jgi:hypothetical protein
MEAELTRLFESLNQNSGAVQALGALGTLTLTAVLVGVTIWYATLTKRAVAISAKQFEREWAPDIRVADLNIIKGTLTVRIVNLSKASAFAYDLNMRIGVRPRKGPIAVFDLRRIVSGGDFIDEPIVVHFSDYIHGRVKNFINYSLGTTFSGVMGISVSFIPAGSLKSEKLQSGWVEFEVTVKSGVITRAVFA